MKVAELSFPKWYIEEETGYKPKTTFWMDFCIAERFGTEAIKDTFNRAFNEWKDDIEYLTELALVTNWKCWDWYYSKKEEISKLYAVYYHQCRDYVYSDDADFSEEDKDYYFRCTD